MALAPLPLVSQTPLVNLTGTASLPWLQWLSSVDGQLRSAVSDLQPMPQANEPLVAVGGFIPDTYAKYWRSFDLSIRQAGWIGRNGAPGRIPPLPPSIGWQMVDPGTMILLLPWMTYFTGVDAVARRQVQ